MQIRTPRIDWTSGFDRHWHGGDAASTHAFNALSFLFPQGEQFFIDVARDVLKKHDISSQPQLEKEVKAFIGQEATHHREHNRYNDVLKSQGFENVVNAYVIRLQEDSRKNLSLLDQLAIVVGYEHYTAILGNYILDNPEILENATSKMALVWGWHSAEETEHKSVCFDLYHAVGGGWLRRVLIFVLVTINFNLMFFRLYLSMLSRDGCLRAQKIFNTLGKMFRFFFGRAGVGWYFIRDGFRFFLPTFHPWDQDNRAKLQDWLETHSAELRI